MSTPLVDWRDALRHGLQVLAFCCVVAVFTTAIWSGSSYGVQLVHSAAIGLVIWAVIEFGRLLVPAHLCHRDPEGRGHGWPKGWRGVVLTAVGIAAGYFGGNNLARALLGEAGGTHRGDFTLGLLVTIAAGAVASFYFFTHGKQAALQAGIAAAERDAAEARLKLLEAQLEPHMLFNTLANLRVLVASDPARAQRMLDHLIAYLRATLGASRATLHPLADEFARLKDYLELMAVRMGPRLHYALEFEPALADVPVPPLLLQPLVENAIRHGLEPEVQGGRIRVSARTQTVGGTNMLALQVCNSGRPLAAGAAAGGTAGGRAFGLAQVRERLRTLYGPAATLELIADGAGHTCANIVFPLNISAP
ncbi:sensor histidine kinase [Comamonas sp. NLF-1-9]|uniref:sensor histidine kinase n=1 Tax=Comamonas sp. NLF-1-9 TaxID=2853163 RepID=UPI001C438467|nr:histidine kinase [Comamonas sp. NLF-1-9]QXL84655.1 sensor histidine kinase [Comamonas sp. NLF-1-9]